MSQSSERVDSLTKDIEERISQLENSMLSGYSEPFLLALRWWARLHRYSFNNALLIELQAPGTEAVAGFKAWQALGFQVSKGSTAIYLRAPWIKKTADKDTGEIEPRLIGYYPVAVFPIECTVEYQEGKRPPELLTPPKGDADWEHLFICWSRRLLTLYGITVKEQNLGNVYGMATHKNIRINSRLDIATKVTTLIHECAHIFAGHHTDPDKDLKQREMEVEAVAYVLAAQLGTEHTAASDYLINYRIQPDQLKANLEVIGKLVKEVRTVLSVGFEPQTEESDLAA